MTIEKYYGNVSLLGGEGERDWEVERADAA